MDTTLVTAAQLATDPRVRQLIVEAVVEAEIAAYRTGYAAGNQEGFEAGRTAGFEDGYAAYEAELAGAMPEIPAEVLERNRLWAEYNLAPPLESPEQAPHKLAPSR